VQGYYDRDRDFFHVYHQRTYVEGYRERLED
jgi:hypothetical protein